MRSRLSFLLIATATQLFLAASSSADVPFSERLPRDILDVTAPSERVAGLPGDMVYTQRSCPAPLPDNELRSHIINTAVQEWAYFGYAIQDLMATRESNPNYRPRRWRRTQIDPDEALRAATSIAGYWSATPNSAWILERQNQSWEAQGSGSRWRNPWSAAFISWVMCESGLGNSQRFQRAIAHHSYIDQAIVARDQGSQQQSAAAYVAYDAGEVAITPGDMLCRGSRPQYLSLAARRAQLGEGARSHCDVVVKLDPAKQQIILIGGNVSSWVRLKLMPGDINAEGLLVPAHFRNRRIFAHLKLQSPAASDNAFEQSPTVQTYLCHNNKLGQVAISEAFAIDCSKSSHAD